MMRTIDWSVGQRLAAGFGLVIVVMALFGVAAYGWQRGSAEAQAHYAQRIAPRTEAVHALERGMMNAAVAIREYLLLPQAARRARVVAAMEEVRMRLAELASLSDGAESARAFASVESRVNDYLAELASIARTGSLMNPRASEEALARARAEAIVHVHAFADRQIAQAHAAIEAMEASRHQVGRAMLAAFAGVAAILVVLGFMTTASIRSPARRLRRIARELQTGHWQAALDFAPSAAAARGETLTPRDELAGIGLAFGAAAEALERREQRLKGDARVANAVSSSLDKARIAEQALQAMAEAAGAAAGVVYWREPEDETLRPIASRALAEQAEPLRVGEGLPGEAARAGQVQLLADIPADSPLRLRLGVEELPPRCVAAVPAMLRGEALGVVVLASLRPFDEAALDFLQSAALQLAIGFNNVRAHNQVQRLLADLRESHDRVQAQNEELQAQNEEIHSQAEELQSQAEELQAQNEEIQSQNEELQRHSAGLSRADERKNEFLGLLAHELRNPLAAIANGVFVVSQARERSPGEAHALRVIERQMRHLTRLIDDLLDVTRISHGKLHLQKEPLDLVELVRDAVQDCRGAADKAGLALQASLPPGPLPVEADRVRLSQVLGNLLSNAIKFTERGGRIDVSLQGSQGDRVAELRVRDTGAGIDPETAARLFEPFEQGEGGTARAKGGLGLGLALARALVELHHGTIAARSEGRGAGSEFVITLPLGTVRAQEPARRKERPAASRERRILVIEDNEDAAETLRMALEFAGHQVAVARCGAEGVDKAQASSPEVILCDIGIPDMDGYEVARRLRADARFARTSLVALSGYATADDRSRSRAAGFDDHLAKPIAVDVLLEKISRMGGRVRDGAMA